MQRKVVGVMGSGSRAYPELAHCVGGAAARLGCHLLTGGGGGVMAEASRAFCETPTRQGVCIGILKGQTTTSAVDGQVLLSHTGSCPNRWVEIPIRTHLPLSGSRGREAESRNHINALSSDVLVALPGGAGTYSEVTLRIDYGGKLILFLGEHEIHGHTAEHLLSLAQDVGQVSVARSPAELETLLEQALEEAGAPAVARSEITSGDDPLDRPYTIPDIRGKRVLVVGVGGGCDIISAFALAEMLKDGQPAKLVYANTKGRAPVSEPLEHLSAQVLKLPPNRIVLPHRAHSHGTTRIDQSVPRGDDGCPLIFLLPEDDGESCHAFVAELRQMAFDIVFSVDTGADSFVAQATSGPDGRDQRMMRLLARLERPWFHVAVSPGCDGEASFSQIRNAVRALCSTDSYLGCLSVAPMLPIMRELAAPLRSTRTPNIIVDACSGEADTTSDDELLTVPRGIRPRIPRRWLSVALVFDLSV